MADQLRVGATVRVPWGLEGDVEGKVVEVQLRKDGDLYFVLESSSGAKLPCEIPDVEACRKSPFYARIKGARKQFVAKLHPTKDVQACSQDIHLTGIGFFARRREATQNGARLMPVLSCTFPSANPRKTTVGNDNKL